MDLITHAREELRRAGYSAAAEDRMDYEIYLQTMRIVEAFSKCDHSGASAAMHASMIDNLLRYQPLGPLTDDPDEWQEVGLLSPASDEPFYQNRRDGRMFSEDGGKTYYSVDELRYGWRARLFGRRGKTYKSEPASEVKI